MVYGGVEALLRVGLILFGSVRLSTLSRRTVTHQPQLPRTHGFKTFLSFFFFLSAI